MSDFSMFDAPASVPMQFAELGRTQAATGLAQAQIPNVQAETKLRQVQAQEAQVKLAREQQLMQLGQGVQAQAGGGGDPASMMDTFAAKALSLGFVKEGGEAAERASQIRAHNATVVKEAADSQIKQLDLAHKALTDAYTMFAGVGNEYEFAVASVRFNQGLTSYPGMKNPFAGMSYEQAAPIIAQLKNEYPKAQTAIKDQMALLNTQSEIRNRDLAEKDREARTRVEEQRLDLSRQREERVAKTAGTKPLGNPSKGELTLAVDAITGEFPKLKGPDLDAAATTIAQEARRIQRANPGIDTPTAMNQALEARKAAGDFKTETAQHFWQSDKTSYTGNKTSGPVRRPEDIKTPENLAPTPGMVKDGYTYKGGDPSKKESWEKLR